MISLNPANPMKGRGAVRFALDCRNKRNHERMLLVAKLLPNHYLCTGHIHYLSPEALNIPIDELRSLKKSGLRPLSHSREIQKAKLLREVEKIKKGIQKL